MNATLSIKLFLGNQQADTRNYCLGIGKWVAQKRIDRLIRDPILFESFRDGDIRFVKSDKLHIGIFAFSVIPLFLLYIVISVFGRLLPRMKFPRYLYWDPVFDHLGSPIFFSNRNSRRYSLEPGFHPSGVVRRLATVSYTFLFSLGFDRNIILNFCKASFFSYRFLCAGVSLSEAWIILLASVSFLGGRKTLFDTVVISNSRWARYHFFSQSAHRSVRFRWCGILKMSTHFIPMNVEGLLFHLMCFLSSKIITV